MSDSKVRDWLFAQQEFFASIRENTLLAPYARIKLTQLLRLKCNRGLPCDTCVRRDKATSCAYASNANRTGKTKSSTSRPRELKDRLIALESLVSSFVQQGVDPKDAVARQRSLPEIYPLGAPSGSDQTDNDPVNSTAEQLRKSSGLGSAHDHLESDQASTSKSTISHDSNSESHDSPENGQVNYIDPSHWLSILEDIKEVREHLSVSSQPATSPARTTPSSADGRGPVYANSDPSLMHGLGNREQVECTIDDILASLPSKAVCDMLLSWYFNSQFMILSVVHPDKFQAEYESFWASPRTTDPLWIALLCGLLTMSSCLRQIANIHDPTVADPPVSFLQKTTIECLILGRYATAQAHALEAFILHLQSSFMTAYRSLSSRSEAMMEPWFLMGTIIRLAFRMGYHRDPDRLNCKNNNSGQRTTANLISPFDGEMRRRVWLNIFQIDALMSFQIGMPSMISAEACDTKVPRNLEYADLQPDMTSLPPSKPLSVSTTIQYIIVKASIMAVFKKITAHASALGARLDDPAYSEKTRALDAEVRAAFAAVPPVFQVRNVSKASFLDSACVICQRATIEMLFRKALIVLHRRYVTYEDEGIGSGRPVQRNGADALDTISFSQQRELSRKACLDAGLDVLARQADLHRACSPGGRLHHDRIMLASSIPSSDFLLGAMVVCLELSVRLRTSKSITNGNGGAYDILGSREYQALQTSHKIYAAVSNVSPDAHTAALALGLMIRKVAEHDCGGVSSSKQTQSPVSKPDGPDASHPQPSGETTRTPDSGYQSQNNYASSSTNDTSTTAEQFSAEPFLPQPQFLNPSTGFTPKFSPDFEMPIEYDQQLPQQQVPPPHQNMDMMEYDTSELSYALPMSLMIDGSESIDWGLLDQFLQNNDPSVQDQTMSN